MTFEGSRPFLAHTEQQARNTLARGAKRVVVYLPTGGGKTLTAITIIQKAVDKGRKVVFLANRKQLVRQTTALLHRYGIAHGFRLRTPVSMILTCWLPPSTRCMFAVCRMMLA